MWLRDRGFRQAAAVGTALANQMVANAPDFRLPRLSRGEPPSLPLQHFLAHVDREARPLQLGPLRRAKLANSFKWRLLDHGVQSEFANELTRMLLLRLSAPHERQAADEVAAASVTPPKARDVPALMVQAEACGLRGADAEAAGYYRQVLAIKPRHARACNNLGVALYKLGQFAQSEEHFRQAVRVQPEYPDALRNLGNTLRVRGRLAEAELPLRQALRISPGDFEAQWALGQTLVLLGRLSEAQECFHKVLKVAPGHNRSLCGLGQIAALQGRFADALARYEEALQKDAASPAAVAGLIGLRRMQSADRSLLKAAEKLIDGGLPPQEEALLRFAIGKFHDDTGEHARAFRNFERANTLQKTAAAPYDRALRERSVTDLIRAWPQPATGAAHPGASDSARPVFVVGMMRSGTSLVEQIIAAHPDAAGAGELPFWNDAALRHREAAHIAGLSKALRSKLAAGYLEILDRHGGEAARVVDKSTLNMDHLGLIHSVFPQARFIHVQRDARDTCLSCYFQPLAVSHDFAMDLGDLAHYYGQQQRLVAHWRSVLPAGTWLEVPYAALVGEQEQWTRRMLDFIGLGWHERCLEFHTAQRPVMTASFWQVRQKMYRSSVDRWQHYRRFLGPLADLR